jgi:hypothetical protein
MTQHDFQENYAKITGFSWSQLEMYLEVAPCNCGKRNCPGWQMITLPTRLPPLPVSRRQTDLHAPPRTSQVDPRARRHLTGAQL